MDQPGLDAIPETLIGHFGYEPEKRITTIADEFAEFEKVEQQAHLILDASFQQLQDAGWLAERVRQAGLLPFEHGEETYGADTKYMNVTHQGVAQLPTELAQYWLALQAAGVRTHIEIGSLSGHNAILTAAFLHRCGQPARVVTIDLDPSFVFYEHVRGWLPLEFHLATSYHFGRQVFDSVLIDGDHTAKWVMADWYNLGVFATKIAALHDIKSQDYSERRYGGVPGMWRHLQAVANLPNSSFTEISHHPAQDRFGIGMRVLR